MIPSEKSNLFHSHSNYFNADAQGEISIQIARVKDTWGNKRACFVLACEMAQRTGTRNTRMEAVRTHHVSSQDSRRPRNHHTSDRTACGKRYNSRIPSRCPPLRVLFQLENASFANALDLFEICAKSVLLVKCISEGSGLMDQASGRRGRGGARGERLLGLIR